MKQEKTLIRSGLAAIAAATALSSTLVFAQVDPAATTGPIVLPESSLPSTTVAPTIVVPEVAPVEPMPSVASVAKEAPTATVSKSTTRQPAPAPRTVSARTTAPTSTRTSADNAATIASPATDAPLPVSELPSSTAAPAPIVAQTVGSTIPVQSQRSDVTEGLAKLLAGLLVAGAAIGGLVLLLRRRRGVDEALQPAMIERPIVREPLDVPTAAVETIPAAPATASEPELSNAGAAVALPRVAPTDYQERTTLLRRMVAAHPDRANPFRSPAARLKRARLIVASLGRKFETSTPRIDLSEYTANWPALARRNRTALA